MGFVNSPCSTSDIHSINLLRLKCPGHNDFAANIKLTKGNK